MIEINLGNSVEQFGSGVSTFSIIEELGNKAKDVIGFKCTKTGQVYDLHSYLRGPISVAPIKTNTAEHLEMIRNDAGHILSHVLSDLYNAATVDIKITEHGFYVDFYCDKSISEHDFGKIEKKMNQLIMKNDRFIINSLNKEEALGLFEQLGNKFASTIVQNSNDECFSVHTHGNHKVLAEGSRSLSTKSIGKHFKILSISGSEWEHGSEKLQRIHGTCWYDKESLESHLKNIEENLKWDHRIIGKQMSMFNIDPEIASGMVFWLPNGVKALNKIREYLRSTWVEYGYQEVSTPIVMNSNLWDKSGHTEMFRENMMFMSLQDNDYALKPMSCPAHINIFKLGNKSYRDLPYKLSEFGLCHRYEPSGSLQGLMRARSFTQDDAHVFVSEEQIEGVILDFCEMVKVVYKKFGFDKILVCLATRPEKYIGEISAWDQAERALLDAANKSDLNCTINEGEGAFYGPKLEFSIKDRKGHVWQCGTVQVDFSLAKRLEAFYTDENADRKAPVVIHHAVLGSLERFFGILLENTKGLLPSWVHPYPIAILPIKNSQEEYANSIKNAMKLYSIDCEIDNSNQTLGYKIKHWIDKRTPYILIIGAKEEQSNKVTLRLLDGKEESLTLEELISKIGAMKETVDSIEINRNVNDTNSNGASRTADGVINE
ncbi:threonine--tRNA ligase [Candidatus Cytomitobacter primus]|uniref:Threonine--tRNA ligase n=1 Tax=Candidatus Cytomitobacter primus TaxID=2066024 RepID=A0A5C0UFC7_9PROT|nr:threonine--tRNA ligase [Candidatus Cytomitobacter primus]QEK38420.1 threonine--tRNA ligase [Candidatus Cytomitobacter primus]